MSDFNSVPPASSNQYGNQVEEGSGAEQAPVSSNNSKKSENLSMQRAGSNESSTSKGDKEHSSDSDSKKDSKFETYAKGRVAEEAIGQAVGHASGAATKGMMAGLKSSVQSMVNTIKALPKMVVKTVTTVVISAFAGIIAAIASVSGVSSVIDEDPQPVYVAYVDKGAIGVTNANADTEQLKREVARKIWSVMSGMSVMNHPDGLTYVDSSTGADTGIAIKVSYGLRPEQICGLLGNWEHESGLDPTSVETCFGDDFNIGQKKQFAIINDFVTSLWGCYDSTTKTYFENHPKIFKSGIGLAQWTDVVSDTDGDGDYSEEWDIASPGRNTKLMTYSALFGDEYYNRKDGLLERTGWNGEKWVQGDSNTEAQWYDLRVQLAYALDTSSLGDTNASWLTNTWNSVGEDFWVGDEHIELKAGTMYDNVLQGWDVNQTFNSDTGWDTSLFTIVDNKVTYNENVNAVGDNTVDRTFFRGTDITLEDSNATDDYYNTSNADYVNLVNTKYSEWTPAKAGSTNWTDIGSAVNYSNDGTMPSGSDAARNLAFNYANKTADLFWHGNLDTTDPLTQPLDTVHHGYQHDFLMENNPRTYDMSGYQRYYTAEEAAANNIESLRIHTHTGCGPTCSLTEHTHTGCGPSCSLTEHTHGGCGPTCSSSEHTHGGCGPTCSNTSESHTHTGCGPSCSSSEHTHTGCGSSCSLTEHTHTGCGPSCTQPTHKAGYVKTGNPCDTANSFAKQQYINCFKYYYRYHLYRYMSLYYSAQFVAEYEGVPGNAIESRFTNSNKWFNEWWKASENEGNDYSEPNYYSPLDKTANAYGFKDYFFRTEEGYASGIRQAIARTQDSLEQNQEKVKVYNHDIYMGSRVNRKTFVTNRDIAIAACLIAWPQKVLSCGNDGIDAYQFIHDSVMKGDTIYQSCDRTVCTAVRWSGVDDNFPGGPTLVQIEYLSSSPRWTEICWGGDVEQLQPGDILIRKDSLASGSNLEGGGIDDGSSGGGAHHILIYTGTYFCESYDTIYGGTTQALSGSNIVHGSFGSRSPAMDVLYNDLRSYHAFRCTDPQESTISKYNSVKYSY